MSDFDFANDSMLELYLFESTTLLDQLDDILLQSEKENDLSQENVAEIFRIMHTIKGSSAMMEFETISHVAHKLEDLFFVVREKGVDENYFQELFDLVLKVSDYLKDEVEKIRQGQSPSAENGALIDEILDLLERMKAEGDSPKPETEKAETIEPETEKPDNADKQEKTGRTKKPAKKDKKETKSAAEPMEAVETAATAEAEETAEAKETTEAEKSNTTDEALETKDENTYHLHVTFAADCQMENIRAFMLANKLESVGKVLKTIPEELETNKDASSIISQNGFYLSVTTALPPEKIIEMAKGTLSVYTVKFIDALPDAAAKTVAPEASAAKASDSPGAPAEKTAPAAAPDNGDSLNGKLKQQNLISVDLNKLDKLMDLVGEIVITESMVSGSADLAGLELDNFTRAARQLRKLTDELQDIVMSIRMVPIASTFQKMRRIVRDMGKKLSKEVELILVGETTEVDKTIIDAIGDPLMHLVRNAMDHAIEDRETRIHAGKDPVGRIILSAQNVGGDIIISVSDDGKGLDPQLILEKAKAKKLLTKPESEYTEKEIFNLLTVPGFSTKDSVTEFSGRGVGMDVVKNNIEKIGGTVTIESVKGIGTNVYFKIPLTLAIIASMEIRVGDQIYAIPIANIRESFKAAKKQLLSDPDGNEMIMIRGACYPIIRLHRIFHIEEARTEITEGILLLVDSGDRMACLLADELLGNHQVVVKTLPTFLSRYVAKDVGIAGCTIMGDGSICLILDIPGILNKY